MIELALNYLTEVQIKPKYTNKSVHSHNENNSKQPKHVVQITRNS